MESDLFMAAVAAFSLWLIFSGVLDLVYGYRARKLLREPWVKSARHERNPS